MELPLACSYGQSRYTYEADASTAHDPERSFLAKPGVCFDTTNARARESGNSNNFGHGNFVILRENSKAAFLPLRR
jgi:hypothetical protein